MTAKVTAWFSLEELERQSEDATYRRLAQEMVMACEELAVLTGRQDMALILSPRLYSFLAVRLGVKVGGYVPMRFRDTFEADGRGPEVAVPVYVATPAPYDIRMTAVSYSEIEAKREADEVVHGRVVAAAMRNVGLDPVDLEAP